MNENLDKLFESLYANVLTQKDYKNLKFGLINNVNIDILHKTTSERLNIAVDKLKTLKSAKEIILLVERALPLAYTTGGEMRIDNYRNKFEEFNSVLEKTSVETKTVLGGNAGNASAALSMLGGKSYLCGAVRNDEHGKSVMRFLKQYGVNTKYIKLKPPEIKQAVTFGVEILNKDRVLFADGSDNRFLQTSKEFTEACIKNKFNCILVLGLHVMACDYENALEFIKKVKSSSSAAIITDSGDCTGFPNSTKSIIFKIFSSADVACFNENELAEFSKLFGYAPKNSSIEELVAGARILNKKTNNIICVHTQHYSFCIDGHKIVVVPSLKPKRIKIKTGIGDCFVAGFAFGFRNGRDRHDSMLRGLLIGNAAAASRLQTGAYSTFKNLTRGKVDMDGINELGKLNLSSQIAI